MAVTFDSGWRDIPNTDVLRKHYPQLAAQQYMRQTYREWVSPQVATTGPASTMYYQSAPQVGTNQKQVKKGVSMLGEIKEYIGKHKDVIFTLGLVILVDHFLFGGALRDRIKTTVEGVIGRVEETLKTKKEVTGGTK